MVPSCNKVPKGADCEHGCAGYSICLRTFLGAGTYFQNVSENHLSGNNHSATLIFVQVLGCLSSVMSEGSNSSHSYRNQRQRKLKLRKTVCPSKSEPGISETWLLFPACGPAARPPHPSVSSLKSKKPEQHFCRWVICQWDAQAIFNDLHGLKRVVPSQEVLPIYAE